MQKSGVNVFDSSRPMWQTMAVFLIPLMLSNVMQSASQTFAAIFVGRMIGVDALAAMSAVFPVFFLLFSFLIGIATGSTVLIGQAYGAQESHRVKKIAGTVLGAVVGFGMIIAAIGWFTSPTLLQWLGTPQSILPTADAYLRLLVLTMPVMFPYIVYTTFLRGTGDAQTPFYFLIVGTVLSILFVPAFIAGWFGLPHLGVLAAVVGGTLAQSIAFAAFLITLSRRKHLLRFDAEMARDMLVDWPILWTVLRIGIPTGIQVIMVSLAELAVISFVNRYGVHATAAYGAVNQIIGYVQFPAMSIGITASIFGAQCIGARREDLLGSVVRSAVMLNYVIGVILIGTCYLAAWKILAWFTPNLETLQIAHSLLMISLWSYLLFGNSAVISGVVRSSGAVLWPMINGIVAIWAVEVPFAYYFMQKYGVDGIWYGYPISYAVVLMLQFGYYEFFWKGRIHERLA